MADYRIGIIGCGRAASEFEDLSPVRPASIAGAFAALPETTLVAAASRGEERLRRFGERWGVSALYHDYREMLAKERLDVVAVATHPPLHREMVVAAAEAGVRGIFCEKPMALSLGDCDAMLAACAQRGVPLLVNCTRRWDGQVEAVRRLLESGSLGALLHVSAHCQGCKPYPAWQAEHEGPLLHDAVHALDILRFFAGDAAWVIATATRRRRPEFGVEDTTYGILTFRNGVGGTIMVDEVTEYERFDIELQCERGLARLGWAQGIWRAREIELEKPWWSELVHDALPAPAWEEPGVLVAARDLVTAIETGRPVRCSGHDGRAAVEIIMAIYESERHGHAKVTLPLTETRSTLELLRQRPDW